MKTFLRDVLTTFLLAVVVYVGLSYTVVDYAIHQSSMEPTFQSSGQRVLVNKVIYKFRAPARGDVIILHPPQSTDPNATPFIKRIIALPGESVDISSGEVRINGVKLNEPYIKEPVTYTYHLAKVPENEYFVLGDNRNISEDSHFGWTVPRQDIIGEAWLTIWPPGKWGLVSNFNLPNQVPGLTPVSNP